MKGEKRKERERGLKKKKARAKGAEGRAIWKEKIYKKGGRGKRRGVKG